MGLPACFSFCHDFVRAYTYTKCVITLLNQVFVVFTDLIFVPSEAAALHGAGVEVALVVKLEAGQAGVQLVKDGRQAATQCQQLGAGAVEANTHGALQGHASSITKQ